MKLISIINFLDGSSQKHLIKIEPDENFQLNTANCGPIQNLHYHQYHCTQPNIINNFKTPKELMQEELKPRKKKRKKRTFNFIY